MSESLLSVLMSRDGLSRSEARELILEARERVLSGGEDPEDILHEEFGLEPDFIFDLLGV